MPTMYMTGSETSPINQGHEIRGVGRYAGNIELLRAQKTGSTTYSHSEVRLNFWEETEVAFRAIRSPMNPGNSDNAHPQSVTTAYDDEFSELVEFSIAR